MSDDEADEKEDESKAERRLWASQEMTRRHRRAMEAQGLAILAKLIGAALKSTDPNIVLLAATYVGTATAGRMLATGEDFDLRNFDVARLEEFAAEYRAFLSNAMEDK